MGRKKDIQPDIELIQSRKFPIELVDNNTGQIPGVPENPREMSEMEYKKLLKSLRRDSQYTAVSELKLFPLDGRWVAIGGNMRLQAMKELGWEYAIGKPLPEDTDAETLTRWILLDNANFGKWDFDRLANQFDMDLLSDMNIDIPSQPEPEVEEEAKDDKADIEALKPSVPKSKPGDIYRLGDHLLICGDSTDMRFLDALMQDELADCIIVDPSDVIYKGGTMEKLKIANDNMEDSVFLDFLSAAFGCADRHLKQGGAFYIWHSDHMRMIFEKAFERLSWKLQTCLIWNKNSLVLGRLDYQIKHEPCLYGWKEGAAHYFTPRRDLTTVFENKPDLDSMTKEELKEMLSKFIDGEIPTTVINEDKPLRNGKHPTMKPVPLIGRQIKNSTRRGDIVLDIFGGSGTTLIACHQLGRKCRMVEYDPVYVDVIIKRWEQLTGEGAVFIGNCLDNSISDNNSK